MAQPLGDRVGLAVGQKIHHAAPFQITQNGAVALAFAPRPNRPYLTREAQSESASAQGLASKVAQQWVAAHYQTQSLCAARPCRTAQRQSQPAQGLFLPCHRKSGASAQSNPHWDAVPGQISQSPLIITHGYGWRAGRSRDKQPSDESHAGLRQCGRPLRAAAPPALQRGKAIATGSCAAGKSPQLPSLLDISAGLALALLTVLLPLYTR
jgi:hypothetical protein